MGDPIGFTDETGHSIFSAIARLFKQTTNSPGANRIPAGLRRVPSGKDSAVLHKVGIQDVKGAGIKENNAGALLDHFEKQYDVAKGRYDRAVKRVAKYPENVKYKEKLSLTGESFYYVGRQYQHARRDYNIVANEYDFLSSNIGEKTITRMSSEPLKKIAKSEHNSRKNAYRNVYGNPLTKEQMQKRDKRLARTAGNVRSDDFLY